MKKTKMILVVDDNCSMRHLLEELFVISGYNSIICEDGKHAIPHIESADLLITDFNMPGINGAELTKIAKREKPNMPVIIITGTPWEVPNNHQADRLVEKPFSPKQLQKIIIDLLQ